MSIPGKKIRRFLSAYENRVRPFLYSDLYLLLIIAVVLIGWLTKCAPLGLTGLILLSCAALFAADDVLPFTVNIFAGALLVYSTKDNEPAVADLLAMWPLLIFLGISIAYFAIHNFRRPIYRGKMFLPQIAVAAALLVGGIGVVSGKRYLDTLPMGIFLGIGVLAVYLLFTVYLKRNTDKDVPKYFAKSLALVGMAVGIELIVCIIRGGIPSIDWGVTGGWNLGWGNRNNVSTYLLLTGPMCFYLATRSKHPFVWYACAVFQYVCIILTFSRGGILFGFVTGLAGLILSVLKAPKPKKNAACVGIGAAILLIAYFIFFKDANDMFRSLYGRGFGLSGRDDLWLEAWSVFKRYPVLGAGFGYEGPNYSPETLQVYFFHSTFFQIIACMGLFGVVAYAWYYVRRFGILFVNGKSRFNMFVLVSWIGFEGYCLVDTATFSPYPYMMLLIVTLAVLELVGKTDRFEGISLPEPYDNEFVRDFDYDSAA